MDSADWASFGDYWLTTALLEDRAESAPFFEPEPPAAPAASVEDDR